VYKLYAESFRSQTHLDTIVAEAQRIVGSALAGAAA
jgi:phosphoglucomutase